MITEDNPSKRQKTGDESASSSAATVIANVWQTIEPYLLLEDTISIAETCKTLHDTIIDTDTRKVKITHFTTFTNNSNQYKTMVNYLPWALNRIHFPSLHTIRYPPDEKYFEIASFLDTHKKTVVSSFPMFVAYLSMACNLESLTLDASEMLARLYDDHSLKKMVRIFGRNLLSCCTKLKKLDIVTKGYVKRNNEDHLSGSYCSVSLIKALTPIIKKRKDDLEVLSVCMNGSPIERDDESIYEFFNAVLSTTKVQELRLGISCGDSRAASALRRLADKRSTEGDIHSNLQNLSLLLRSRDDDGLDNEQDEDISLAPLFESFSDCHSLKNINLYIPIEFWEDRDNGSSLVKLLENKPNLKTLVCDFGGLSTLPGHLITFAEDCKRNKYPSITTIHLKNVGTLTHSTCTRLHNIFVSIGMSELIDSTHGGASIIFSVNKKLKFPQMEIPKVLPTDFPQEMFNGQDLDPSTPDDINRIYTPDGHFPAEGDDATMPVPGGDQYQERIPIPVDGNFYLCAICGLEVEERICCKVCPRSYHKKCLEKAQLALSAISNTAAETSEKKMTCKHCKDDLQVHLDEDINAGVNNIPNDEKENIQNAYEKYKEEGSFPFNTIILCELLQILSKLSEYDYGELFIAPVDTGIITDYLKTVHTPMDYGTIISKLEKGEYAPSSEDKDSEMDAMEEIVLYALKDILQVHHNCYLYNPKGGMYHRAGEVQARKWNAYYNKHIVDRVSPSVLASLAKFEQSCEIERQSVFRPRQFNGKAGLNSARAIAVFDPDKKKIVKIYTSKATARAACLILHHSGYDSGWELTNSNAKRRIDDAKDPEGVLFGYQVSFLRATRTIHIAHTS